MRKFRVEWKDCDGITRETEVSARTRHFAKQAIVVSQQPYPMEILHIRQVSQFRGRVLQIRKFKCGHYLLYPLDAIPGPLITKPCPAAMRAI